MSLGRRGYYRATMRMLLEAEWRNYSYPWTRSYVRYEYAMSARTL
jgi:hypothetical protein